MNQVTAAEAFEYACEALHRSDRCYEDRDYEGSQDAFEVYERWVIQLSYLTGCDIEGAVSLVAGKVGELGD